MRVLFKNNNKAWEEQEYGSLASCETKIKTKPAVKKVCQKCGITFYVKALGAGRIKHCLDCKNR